MSFKENFTLSSLSLSSEDWDRSDGEINPSSVNGRANSTPRNSVVFPGDGVEDTPRRSLTFSAEEASRVADVLKQWINSGTSPYEGEDDFFSRSQDDSSLRPKRSSRPPMEMNGRPRGQSETLTLRSPNRDSSSS